MKSHRGTQFRIWATQRLREYIVKGFTLDDERLKRSGGGNYLQPSGVPSMSECDAHQAAVGGGEGGVDAADAQVGL